MKSDRLHIGYNEVGVYVSMYFSDMVCSSNLGANEGSTFLWSTGLAYTPHMIDCRVPFYPSGCRLLIGANYFPSIMFYHSPVSLYDRVHPKCDDFHRFSFCIKLLCCKFGWLVLVFLSPILGHSQSGASLMKATA